MCERDNWYKRSSHRREAWWRQELTEKQRPVHPGSNIVGGFKNEEIWVERHAVGAEGRG